ncbi:alkaline phosphatase D family protein [Reichenbachiella versicolor]|uniref:alkaline phosphatase D family protein n=1 Tax=Reichenbachiella versicolor TaxID=1821036 RepID=UPI001C88AEE1|nr:alkaline phosphatase D family protein [Reichenbachiella versicolor]
MKTRHSLSLFISFIFLQSIYAQKNGQVYFTTGFKMGEVTSSSVVIHTRLNKSPKSIPTWHQRKDIKFRHPIRFDNSMPVEKMDGAVQGSAGQVKITLVSEDTISTDWEYVSAYRDFTIKKKITGLKPNTNYQITIYGRKTREAPITEIKGSFKTAPNEDEEESILFTVSTCQYYWSHDDSLRGFKMYDSMLELDPAFHCQTGDYVYYDKPGPMANTVEKARHKWHAMNSWPSLRDFYSQVPTYLQKDDHDLLKDDATPYSTPFGQLTYEDGLAIWREQVPIVDKPYRTKRWGKDLQIWLVENREYRSDNHAADGANKTIWGKEQIQWFKETVESSDATFKILVSATPIVGPDRKKGKIDNHSNDSFQTEGEWLRKYLADQDVLVVNGDRHWQYVSQDRASGLMEFSAGPVSDYHAQGWNQNDLKPEHKFLRVKGGFLAVKVSSKSKTKTVAEFIHYDVEGNEVNKESIVRRLD